MNKKHLVTIIVLINSLTACSSTSVVNTGTTENSNSVQKSSPTASPMKTPDKPTINVSYDIVEKWQTAEGGENKRITIPANLKTEEELLSVCDKIKEDVKNDKIAFIFGHRNAKSADIQKRFDKATAQEKKYLGENFILYYVKSPTNRVHECKVFVNGSQGGIQNFRIY